MAKSKSVRKSVKVRKSSRRTKKVVKRTKKSVSSKRGRGKKRSYRK